MHSKVLGGTDLSDTSEHLIDNFVSRLEEFNKIDQERLGRIKKELLDLGAKNVKTVIELGKIIPVILKAA